MKKVAYDLDGVVIDTYELIRKCLLENFNLDFKREEHTTYYFKVPKTSEHEVNVAIAQYLHDHWEESQPMPGSIWAIKKIAKITQMPPVFITARSIDTYTTTNMWLRKHLDIPYFIHLTTFTPKEDIVKDLKVDYFVEDRYKEAISCAPVVEKMFLYNSPWNMNRDLTHDNIIRIDNLNDMISYL